ncbi:Uncharacterised protein [Yersinia enterocolitica]|nr:Uncharacterised protein [Yersinia enterocolitica]
MRAGLPLEGFEPLICLVFLLSSLGWMALLMRKKTSRRHHCCHCQHNRTR